MKIACALNTAHLLLWLLTESYSRGWAVSWVLLCWIINKHDYLFAQ